MFFSHLECSTPCGAGPFDARARHHLCPGCGMPLLARYDMERARGWRRESLTGRVPTMWRYREMLPLFPGESPVTLGEGYTPLLHTTRLGEAVGLPHLFIKDESFNPTSSFKSRGPVRRRHPRQEAGRDHDHAADRRQCRRAAGAYAAPPDCAARCHASGRQAADRDECRLYGAKVELVDGLITDAGRLAADQAKITAGTTSRPSRSRTASRARRRWATSSPNSSSGRCPT